MPDYTEPTPVIGKTNKMKKDILEILNELKNQESDIKTKIEIGIAQNAIIQKRNEDNKTNY